MRASQTLERALLDAAEQVDALAARDRPSLCRSAIAPDGASKPTVQRAVLARSLDWRHSAAGGSASIVPSHMCVQHVSIIEPHRICICLIISYSRSRSQDGMICVQVATSISPPHILVGWVVSDDGAHCLKHTGSLATRTSLTTSPADQLHKRSS